MRTWAGLGHRGAGGGSLIKVRVTRKLASQGVLNCLVARCVQRTKSRQSDSTDKMEFQKAKCGERQRTFRKSLWLWLCCLEDWVGAPISSEVKCSLFPEAFFDWPPTQFKVKCYPHFILILFLPASKINFICLLSLTSVSSDFKLLQEKQCVLVVFVFPSHLLCTLAYQRTRAHCWI